MLSKRFLGLVIATLLFVMFSMSIQPSVSVYAEELLQDLPRLDDIKVYFTEAGGEASRFDRSDLGLSRFAGLLSQLGADLFTLEWRTGFPSDADLIVIAGPTSDFAPDQIARLWSYMNNGGRVLLLANANVGARGALASSNGLFQLMWSDMGLRARDDVLVAEGIEPIYATPEAVAEATEPAEAATDEAAATDAVEAETTPEPPVVIGEQPILISEFMTGSVSTTSPITEGLQGDLAFFTARSLEVDSSIQGFEVTPLVFTDDTFYGETAFPAYLQEGAFAFNIGSDTTRGALPIAAAYDNETTDSRVILIGDREFATNGEGLQTSPSNSAGFIYPANARFLVNAAIWLLDREAVEIEFPTAAPTATATITPSITPTRTPTGTPTPEGGAVTPEATSEATEDAA